MSLNNLAAKAATEGRTDLLNNLDLQWFAEEGAGEPGGGDPTPEGDPGSSDPGDQKAGWLSGVGEEYRDHEFVKDKKTPTDMVKAAIEMREKLKTAAYVPGENATDEDRAAWRKAKGVPDGADGYQLDTSGLPKELVNDELTAWFAKNAHELGIGKSEAEALFKRWNEKMTTSFESAMNQKKYTEEQGKAELEKEWGESFKANMNRAALAVKRFGGNEFAEYLDQTGLTNDPRMIKAMHEFASLVSEDEFQGDGGPGGGGPVRRKAGQFNLSASFPED
jgi:hypothetical protein